jgi:hypothetical protein
LTLAETARWLTTPEKRVGKQASTMVISLAGTVTMEDLGTPTLIAFNRLCTIQQYFQFSPTQQCNKCQRYGHPLQKCPATTPTCGVCAENHSTSAHPCTIPACKAGPTCTHPPICCINCKAPHKATDPNCPQRIMVQEMAKQSWLARQMPTVVGMNV